jgi:regulator of sirC expression with transglutaminase-like and TPR domain
MQAIKGEVDAFARIVALDDDHIDLGEAALLIAKDEYPNLDVKKYLKRLDLMAQHLKEVIGNQTDPKTVIKLINKYLFEELGFEGNRQEHADPKNSFLNDVLDRKKGLPITLSLIYIELARRLKLPIYGVGLPLHFIVKYKTADNIADNKAIKDIKDIKDIYIDPYNFGAILSEADCKSKVSELYVGKVEFKKEFLDVVSKKQILVRMLNNLRAIYYSRAEYRKLEQVVKRILLITPDSPEDTKLMGFLRYGTSDYPRALWYFKRYLHLEPNALDADQIRRYIEHSKRNLAELN